MGNPHGSNRNDTWRTPEAVFEALNLVLQFEIDAASSVSNRLCSNHWTLEDSALNKNWSNKTIWCNPPYSMLPKDGRWVEKFKEMRRGALLLPPKTDTVWWHELLKDKDFHLLHTRGRIAFRKPSDSKIKSLNPKKGKASSPTLPMLFLLKCEEHEVRKIQLLLSVLGYDPLWMNEPNRSYQSLHTLSYRVKLYFTAGPVDVANTTPWQSVREACELAKSIKPKKEKADSTNWSMALVIAGRLWFMKFEAADDGEIVLQDVDQNEFIHPFKILRTISATTLRNQMVRFLRLISQIQIDWHKVA